VETVGYDTLIVAGGSEYSYFGRDEWEQPLPAPKALEEALEIRRRLLSAFEAAETEQVVARRERWLMFVVVGADRREPLAPTSASTSSPMRLGRRMAPAHLTVPHPGDRPTDRGAHPLERGQESPHPKTDRTFWLRRDRLTNRHRTKGAR